MPQLARFSQNFLFGLDSCSRPYLYSEDYFSQLKFIALSFSLKFIFRMYYSQRIEFIVLDVNLDLLDSNICGLCYMLQITVISLVMVERALWNRLPYFLQEIILFEGPITY